MPPILSLEIQKSVENEYYYKESSESLRSKAYRILKRLMDILVASFALLFLIIPMLLTSPWEPSVMTSAPITPPAHSARNSISDAVSEV